MPSLDARRVLVGLGLLLAALDVATAGLRTAIPRALDGVVTKKEVLAEKHAGVDDVCRIALDGAEPIQVEHALFDRVEVGERLKKSAWSRSISVSEKTIELSWSHDARGMVVALPLLALAALVLARLAKRRATAP